MAKIVRRKKKKRFKLMTFSFVFLMFSATLYLASSLFLRTYNNALSSRKQEIESKIAVLEVENSAVKVEIQRLITKDRVDNIADENGLRLNQNNIVAIASVGE